MRKSQGEEPEEDKTEEETEVSESAPVEETGTESSGLGGEPVEAAENVSEWRKPYEELGFQDIETPEEASQRLINAYRTEREQREAAQRDAQFYKVAASQYQPPASDDQPKSDQPQTASDRLIDPFVADWVEIDQALVSRYARQDEDGNWEWAPDVPADLRSAVDKYQTQTAKWGQVLNDPRTFIKAVDERIETILGDRVNGVLSERDTIAAERQAEQKFFQDNADWFFDRDPVSGGVAKDYSGQELVSVQGRQFLSALAQAESMGVKSVKDQITVAQSIMEANKYQTFQQQQSSQQTNAEVAEANRRAMLGRVNQNKPAPNGSAGVSPPLGGEEVGQQRMSASRKAILSLKSEGYDLGV